MLDKINNFLLNYKLSNIILFFDPNFKFWRYFSLEKCLTCIFTQFSGEKNLRFMTKFVNISHFYNLLTKKDTLFRQTALK